MGDHLNQIHSAEETGAVERQRDLRVPAHVGNVKNLTRHSLAVAVMAFATMLDSCGGEVESAPGGEAAQAPENVDALRERMVFLSGNRGGKWRFQGNYPQKEFRLVVKIDGEEVSTQNIKVDHALNPNDLQQFYAEGPVGQKAMNVHVQAFDLDEKEIVISNDPAGTVGMLGTPDHAVGSE